MLNTIVIRGGGDLATGIAHRLFKAGYKIIILEIEKPLAIRRRVSFSEAIYTGETTVEGVRAVLSNSIKEIKEAINRNTIPVYIDKTGNIIREIKPLAVVDAIIAKRNLGTNRSMAPITIGVGPGFEAELDVDLVVESKRGHYLGKVIYQGQAAKNTGIPGETMGYTEERIIRSPKEGKVKSFFNIGDTVNKGEIVCQVGDAAIEAKISGILRGLIREGLYVPEGTKIGDIDPRGIRDYAFTISDKARAVAGGVLEAIQYLRNERGV